MVQMVLKDRKENRWFAFFVFAIAQISSLSLVSISLSSWSNGFHPIFFIFFFWIWGFSFSIFLSSFLFFFLLTTFFQFVSQSAKLWCSWCGAQDPDMASTQGVKITEGNFVPLLWLLQIVRHSLTCLLR